MCILSDIIEKEGKSEGIIETGSDPGLSEDDILQRLQNKPNVSLQKALEYSHIKYTLLPWKWVHAEKADGHTGQDFLQAGRPPYRLPYAHLFSYGLLIKKQATDTKTCIYIMTKFPLAIYHECSTRDSCSIKIIKPTGNLIPNLFYHILICILTSS